MQVTNFPRLRMNMRAGSDLFTHGLLVKWNWIRISEPFTTIDSLNQRHSPLNHR